VKHSHSSKASCCMHASVSSAIDAPAASAPIMLQPASCMVACYSMMGTDSAAFSAIAHCLHASRMRLLLSLCDSVPDVALVLQLSLLSATHSVTTASHWPQVASAALAAAATYQAMSLTHLLLPLLHITATHQQQHSTGGDRHLLRSTVQQNESTG
jgi:hypothetical protein